MNIDQQRAAFEAWAEVGAELHKMLGGEYSSSTTRFAWEAWQAALASPEVQALRKDAERYRWLREQHEKPVGWLTICEAGTWDLKPWSGDDPDTTIDAAMEEQK